MSETRALTNVTDYERAYLDMIRRHGQPAPLIKYLGIQEPVSDDGQSDCWTHAWEMAQRTGQTYVEGVCVRAGSDGPSFHAWIERDSPVLGRRVLVECTSGYEDATNYVGIAVDCTRYRWADLLTRQWVIRVSVLQYLLAEGYSIQQVLRVTRETEETGDE